MKRIVITLIISFIIPVVVFCQSWQQMPMHGGGYVTGLISHPSNVNTLYARIDVGGIYVTTNAGDTWESLTKNIIKDSKINYQVRSFAIDETNTDNMYFVSGNAQYSTDAALWISSDAGINWTRKTAPLSIGGNGFARSSGETLLVHPTNDNLLLIGGQPTFNYANNTWNTASEFNNKGFEIYRSNDAANWQGIGFLSGKENSKNPIDYTFLDNDFFVGINYYQLKQVDFSGEYEWSNIEAIEIKNNKEIVVFPNPTHSYIYFYWNENNDFELYNSIGKIVKKGKVISGRNKININDIGKGMYILKIAHSYSKIMVNE